MGVWSAIGMGGIVCAAVIGASPAPRPPQPEPSTPGAQVSIVPLPPTGSRNPHYASSRDPLAPAHLIKLPIGSIEPQGWLRGQLELMRDGMTGHMPELSHWVQEKDNAWLSPTGEGVNGWEEVPYWLKGYGDLGHILHDKAIIDATSRWIEGVLASRRPDGYFGPEDNRHGGPANMQLGQAGKLKAPDLWPHMAMLNVLQSWHEATGDTRILDLMSGYFKWEMSLPKDQLTPTSWQHIRAGDNLESVLWLYNRTGEPWLLDLAQRLHDSTAPWKDKVASWHGVNICQGFREPGIYSQLSKNPEDLAAAERNYGEVMTKYGQYPGGMFGADENARPGFSDPRQMAETCSMVEFMRSFELLGALTGDTRYADRCEEIAFNSLPAAFTPDSKGLRYLTGVNMAHADSASKAPGIANDGQMVSYDPGEAYRCCQHNHAMGWPYFAEHVWMATPDSGLAAFLYAPCEVTATVADGAKARLVTQTGYPFDGAITIKVVEASGKPFPIYLRIPGWAKGATVAVNSGAGDRLAEPSGKYARLERPWKAGDIITLTLPMELRTQTWEKSKNSVSIARGPLWFSLQIGEDYRPAGGSKAWPVYDVFATTPWNYALAIDPANPSASIKADLKQGPVAGQPFTHDSTPIKLHARGRRISQWQLDRHGLTMPLQESPVATAEPEEDITLIPMGAARLRIAAFPVAAGQGEQGHEWKAPPPARHEASHENDDITALSDGIEPRNSADHDIPRFTWWPRRGTTEWVTTKLGDPRRVESVSVYWFDDTGIGACRVPGSWRLLYRDTTRHTDWTPVAPITRFTTDKDRFNEVRFQPVEATDLKIEAQFQPGMSGGILEWKVGGHPK